MTQSKALFAVVAIAVAATVGGFLATPLNGSARAAAGQADAQLVAERIGAAFAVVRMTEAAPAVRAAAVRSAKGDLPRSLGCKAQTWPDVDVGCLVNADGSPAAKARFVTVGSQTGETETVLLRIPASLVASR